MALSKVLLVLCLIAAIGSISGLSITDKIQEALVSAIRSRARSWVAQVYDRPEEFGVMKMSLGLNESELNSLPRLQNQRSVRALPASFDARQKWPYCPSLNQIRSQGSCGSCYAVSTAAVITDRYCIHSGGERQFYFGSTGYLSCCTDCYKCDGGYVFKTFDYWVEYGLTSGGPYHSGQGCKPYPFGGATQDVNIVLKCDRQCQAGYPLTYSQDLKYGASSYILPWGDENAMKAEIYQNGPIVTSFDVYGDFFQYRSGVYRHVTGAYKGSHAVRVIGWGVENGVKYWLCANSWNERWGENGFFKIVRGENHVGVEDISYAGLPKY
ncbi:cathepsin B-like [Culex pipiens pallens]|uniref:cathepsin B-like n=1 Tax=Culex pipiens pallens TaxID=42434 RepID=UPI001953D730|nr:cathepsin B-like [Culex pipiens pallens]